MKPLEMLLANAARSNRRIVLSEGADPRVIAAAAEARDKAIARPLLVGPKKAIRCGFADAGLSPEGVELHDPASSPLLPELAAYLHDRRKHKGMTEDAARAALANAHVFAACLVATGHADGTIGGAVATTAEIVRTAIQVIGTAPDTRLVSSFFLMLFCEQYHQRKGAHVFADSGLVIDPDAGEMAEIARASAQSLQALTGETPRVAMLSFSTRGSASHPSVSKVSQATEMARAADPGLIIDGELQFDAAFEPLVASTKAADSPLEGLANVFVFPNLESGNIAYKIAQRVGGARAIGPILQGLAKPANDLSRGCTSEDILHMIAVTAAQAGASENRKKEHAA